MCVITFTHVSCFHHCWSEPITTWVYCRVIRANADCIHSHCRQKPDVSGCFGGFWPLEKGLQSHLVPLYVARGGESIFFDKAVVCVGKGQHPSEIYWLANEGIQWMERLLFHLAGRPTVFRCFAFQQACWLARAALRCLGFVSTPVCLCSVMLSSNWQGLLQWLVCVLVLHVCMNSEGVGTMKFPSQAKQVQLHSASMQTFIIEQPPFIIHTSGFLCTQQINFFEPVCSSDTPLIDVSTHSQAMNI